ncbi:MAG: rhodanese-like domain-containing protein [gamma proteobacterium symbiont of Lucinoma myriamae]|nr:rhodanese-like domain-containing protein [gamma proteobacterium symbiont of Lucinoma myriamae]MCU7818624.1 rhodanese-like domain-containing protein [gamma proteobacterium symbiont of Lucinoma myriamae]MCU7833185.1 rhodanese-like domain-containing protein [gamma proteobacterium symbiont of Lucinoma myriamae]
MSNTEPTSISPQEALKMLNEKPNSLLIDVRSSMEFLFVGHPKGAVHIAWIDEPDWDINPHFATEIRKLVLGGVCAEDEHTPAIILICRSGKRSFEAGQLLINSGLCNVFNVDEGFEGELNDQHQRSTIGGWRYHNLPWEQC